MLNHWTSGSGVLLKCRYAVDFNCCYFRLFTVGCKGDVHPDICVYVCSNSTVNCYVLMKRGCYELVWNVFIAVNTGTDWVAFTTPWDNYSNSEQPQISIFTNRHVLTFLSSVSQSQTMLQYAWQCAHAGVRAPYVIKVAGRFAAYLTVRMCTSTLWATYSTPQHVAFRDTVTVYHLRVTQCTVARANPRGK